MWGQVDPGVGAAVIAVMAGRAQRYDSAWVDHGAVVDAPDHVGGVNAWLGADAAAGIFDLGSNERPVALSHPLQV
jgi:hypothetical protein